jgi:hypothetical protein
MQLTAKKLFHTIEGTEAQARFDQQFGAGSFDELRKAAADETDLAKDTLRTADVPEDLTRSAMSPDDKVAFIEEHGRETYEALPYH